MRLPGQTTWTVGVCPKSYKVQVEKSLYRQNRWQFIRTDEPPTDPSQDIHGQCVSSPRVDGSGGDHQSKEAKALMTSSAQQPITMTSPAQQPVTITSPVKTTVSVTSPAVSTVLMTPQPNYLYVCQDALISRQPGCPTMSLHDVHFFVSFALILVWCVYFCFLL